MKYYPKYNLYHNFSDELIDIVCRENLNERVYTKYFQPKDGDVILDLGASNGIFARSLSQKINYIAVEASKENCLCIQKNLSNLITYQIYPLAVVSRVGGQLIDISFDNIKDKAYTISFDNLFKMIGHIDFLKVDIEGFEFPICLWSDLIINFIPKIVMELHPCRDFEKAFDIKMFINTLTERGYKVKLEAVDGTDILDVYLGNLDNCNLYYSEILLYAWIKD